MIITLWHDLLSVIFPRVCEVCGRQLVDSEKTICGYCYIGIPYTKDHHIPFNSIEQRLAGGTQIERAASWFEYRRHSPYRQLIHKAKYFNRPDLAYELGRMCAASLQPDRFFDGIDILMPVPMHRLKQLRRGYNQAEEIARGINDVTSIPIADNLIARQGHKSQTRQGTYDRYLNVKDLFSVIHPEELQNMHILVIDDVITTGSTILSCCDTLARAIPDVRISVLAIASATRL